MDLNEKNALESQLKALTSQADTLSQSFQKLTQDLNRLQSHSVTLSADTRHLHEALHAFQSNWQAAIKQGPEASVNDVPEIDKPDTVTSPPVSPDFGPVNQSVRVSYNPEPPKPGLFVQGAQPKAEPREEGWEIAMGIKWFSRIGIVVLLIGLVMALGYAFPMFPAWMKILTGWVITVSLVLTGNKLFDRHTVLGRILQAGGLTMGYVSLFAMFFIPEVALFDAPTLGLILLGGYVVALIALAHRLQSQTIALLSLLFGYYTSSYSGTEEVAYISTTCLGLAAIGLCALHANWCWVLRACYVGAMATYFYWLNAHMGMVPPGATGDWDPKTIYLGCTFMLFHIACFVSDRFKGDVLLLVVNTFVFYLVYSWTHYKELPDGCLEWILCAVQLVSMFYLQFKNKTGEEGHPYKSLIQTCLINALLFMGIATVSTFGDNQVPAILAAEAVALRLASGRGVYPKTLRSAAWVLYGVAYMLLPMTWIWGGFTNTEIMMTGGWVVLCGLFLENRNDAQRPGWLSAIQLALLSIEFLGLLIKVAEGQWLTMTMVITSFALIGWGLWKHLKRYRWTGLVWLLIAGFKLVCFDTIALETPYKILLYLVLGLGLLGASFAYSVLAKNLSGKATVHDSDSGS